MAAASIIPVTKPSRFLFLPAEIRTEIYKFALYRAKPHNCFIYVTRGDTPGPKSYKISPQSPSFGLWRPQYHVLPTFLLLVNRQIHDEARDVLYSAPLKLDFRERYGANHNPNVEYDPCRYFLPEPIERLHSVFKDVRELRLDFGRMPFRNFPATAKWRFKYSGKGKWIQKQLRSLLPDSPSEDSTALRSVAIDMGIDEWDIGGNDISHFWELLDGPITVLPAKVYVQLKCGFHSIKNEKDNERLRRFGDWLETDFARKRTEYIAGILE